MALDNAQFMAELSIVDPPGTDPLSEGDDQIRTAKRTQLQSFPGVDKAVTTTADQLNDVALQSEANTFTAVNTFSGDPQTFLNCFININAGFDSDRGINFQDIGVSRWSVIMGSVTQGRDFQIQRRSGTGALVDVPILLTEARGVQLMTGGRAADPSYSFQGQSGMGMFENSPGVLGFATDGTVRATITNAGIRSNIAGSAGGPSYSFADDADTGMFVILSNQLTFAAGGFEKMRIKTSTINLDTLPTTPGVSGDLYAKQSQSFAGTELLVAISP